MIIDMPASKEFIEEVKSEIRRFELWPDQETRSELQEQFTLLDPVDCVDRDKLNSFWRRPFFKKTLEKYGMDFIEQFQHDYMQHLETVLKEKLDSFCIATDPHSDCLLNRRVNAVREHLVAMQGKHEAKCSADIAQYDEIIAVIPELVEQIKHLEDACSTFERELSI
jgi:hypothetical protein